MTDVEPGSIRAWVLAARPATLTAAFAPVAVGTACAWRVGALRWDAALAALFGAFLIQIATNFANDMFDFQKGADNEERLGPTRAAQAGLLTVPQLRRGIITTFALALGTGIYLTWIAGPAVVVIGLASMAAGLAYTGGPFPLAYHGLGDVFVMVFFGFVAVCGTAFVQALFVPQIAWAAAIPIGALATGILVVNNVRDFEGDARAGKTTLVVRFGREGGVREYAFLLAVAYATPVVIFALGWTSAWVCLPLLTILWGVRLFRSVVNDRGIALNETLAETAKLLSLFGILFAIGIAL
ncbi:MAG: 1,4-dihydroxy-2-naphthoate polyprenyltransferase [Deltaproteobacteria bacterium]|nr:1,4-dihydroxy-2-naphthoate polyprenyltransferase [Deltaproteobacteria bacterium]MBW1876164.1 1,4-dihydroxy-2-naphthoate polyprenyltransferase [Deltaproteobacteria bacterium]MBW2211562.1 1,4-dihydroxy-2-naphthoate polyprenyltransferase [Deltaproteobacteria bacterium]MBW2213238.1 1,4-dihydroxy-2-naphthoate polyprenyltransferase [Deltaproteobacteria bacterium]MBW2381615.1 1,4-dihydroxy-2-naphthoate polyprenyltransferase [Deltaproteobacteria bacterium]